MAKQITLNPEIKKLQQVVDSLTKKYHKEPHNRVNSSITSLQLVIRELTQTDIYDQ